MSKFLDDDRLGPAIRQLTQGAGLRCAVAFWGEGAARALFSDSQPPSDARLICDVSMGGSNPGELKSLGAPHNTNLRHLPGLHAKVYLSGQGLITSSANASNNGVGFLDVARLVEAGTFHAPGSEAFQQAADWFERIWERSSRFDEAALALARRTWRGNLPARTARLARTPDPASLFDVVAADPERFRGVGFVFTFGESSNEHRDETAKAVIREDDKRARPVLSGVVRNAIANWKVGDVFSEWSPTDISAWPMTFVCAHQGRSGRISYWFYERAHTAVLDRACGMVLATRQRTLRRELGFIHGSETMAQVDGKRLLAIFDHIRSDRHRLCESGESLAALLASLDLIQ